MSAPSPRPKAFLGIDNYLLGELRVTLGPFTVYIIENNGLTEAWRLGQSYVTRNHTLKNLRTEKASQICGYLAGQGCSLIVHCEQNTFDFQTWIQSTADSHQRIQ